MTQTIKRSQLKIFISLLLIAGIAGIIFSRGKKENPETFLLEKKPIAVKVKKAQDLKESLTRIEYPAAIVGDQEAKIVSRVNGTAVAINFNLGDKVTAGEILVKIDDQEGLLSSGDEGFVSGQIQQLESSFKQADESYDQAKRAYEKDDTKANKTAKDIAKLQKESALIALHSAMDERLIRTPISGNVISKDVSTGDSISSGQPLATISRSSKIKVQFYLSQEELENVKLGETVIISDKKKEIPAKVVHISTQSDLATKRFLAEAMPFDSEGLFIGTVLNVLIDVRRRVENNNSIILPLSALIVGQNETYLFVTENQKAKKIIAKIENIFGENAEVQADLPADGLVIIGGNKLIQEGEKVEIN